MADYFYSLLMLVDMDEISRYGGDNPLWRDLIEEEDNQ